MQLSLWQPRCQYDCEIWDECRGSITAPCHCVGTSPSDVHNCDECYLICRERRATSIGVSGPDTFYTQLESGLPLRRLKLSYSKQNYPELPRFIPTHTNELLPKAELSVGMVGIEARYLFTRHRTEPVQVRSQLRNAGAIRQFAKVGISTPLIAVMNGKDWILEGFWGMDRSQFYSALRNAQFQLVTGPTFSVIKESRDHPASHNVAMLLRHHRIVQELHDWGILVAPNLYWRTERDRMSWIMFLMDNPDVTIISRDFQMTKSQGDFEEEFSGLLEILSEVGRPMQVIMQGIWIKKVGRALTGLHTVGASGVIMSSTPVLCAIKHGKKLLVNDDGALGLSLMPDISRHELAKTNIDIFNDFLTTFEGSCDG